MCIVKKINVFFMLISFGVAYPMKRSLEPDNKNQRIVTFKSLKGFPLTSLSKGAVWFSSLSERDKRKVTKNIINHKDERLNALFNIATKFVPDLRIAIACCLYKDDEHVKAFLHMPIAQAYCYEGFLDIINDEKNAFFRERCFQNPHFKPDIICGLAKEITVFGEPCVDRSRDKSELEAIAKVAEIFQNSFLENGKPYYRYEFYESFTLKKFIKEDLRYLPFFLSVFITFALPWFDICGVNERNVRINAIANDFNAEAVRAYQATGSRDFFNARVPMRDEHIYCLNPLVYMKMVSWFSAGIPMYDCFTFALTGSTTLKAKNMMGTFARIIFFKIVESIARSAERPTLGASWVTGLYLLGYCVYHMAVKEKKHDYVVIGKLPALLQRRDICIV